MNEDKMSKEAKCHECIHFPMCDWRTNTYLFADERFKCYCGHYANEKDYHKVGKDEVVLTKGAYESISNKAKANVVKAVEIKQEAAREILQEVVNAWNTGNLNQRELAYICTKNGIELE